MPTPQKLTKKQGADVAGIIEGSGLNHCPAPQKNEGGTETTLFKPKNKKNYFYTRTHKSLQKMGQTH